MTHLFTLLSTDLDWVSMDFNAYHWLFLSWMVTFVLQVGQMERRIVEAAKLGFKKCVVPKSSNKALKGFTAANLVTIPCADIKEVIEKLFLTE